MSHHSIYEMIDAQKFDYLCNSGTEFEGFKIWGSPNSKWFYGVNSHCKAFMCNESKLKKIYADIPNDTDILITHGPPFGMLDKIFEYGDPDKPHYVGSLSLADRVFELKQLKLHVFGHIHEGYGQCYAAYENLDINDPLIIHSAEVAAYKRQRTAIISGLLKKVCG